MNQEWVPFLRPSLATREAYTQLFDEIDARHLYSNFGPLNHRFESRLLAGWFQGQGACTTVANATLGLMLAFQQLKRPGGRYAIMPSFTFAATPQAALWCGLEPYFVDADPETWCMSIDALDRALARLDREVALVVPYTAFGSAFDLAPYRALHLDGVPVVVDAAPAFGTTEHGRQVGSGFPGAVVFSFHATKAFCIGEGGLVYSGDPGLVARLRLGANFGFGPDRQSEFQGLNAKLSEYSAAIGLATLDAFPERIRVRRDLYERYQDSFRRHGLSALGWEIQVVTGQVPTQILSLLAPPATDRGQLIQRLESAGIECRTYFSPACHEQALFKNCLHGRLDVTTELSRRVVSLPFWEGMDDTMVERIVSEVGR